MGSSQNLNKEVNGPGQKKHSRLKSVFNSARYLKNNPSQPLSVLAPALMGTTALIDPLITGSAMGAAAVMAASFYFLMKTSDIVVDNASSIGKKAGISALTLGVALGAITSLPELFVSMGAIMQGSPEIGIGNIIGSNIANSLLILGATAAIMPVKTKGALSWKFNALTMCGASAAFGGLLIGSSIPVMAGAGLMGALALYKLGSYLIAKKEQETRSNEKTDHDKSSFGALPKSFNLLWGSAGIAGLVYSSDILVNSASSFAGAAGISPALIAALGVAIGTSLPELTVNIKAALKGETEMAVGNVLGSNIFNILMVGGALGLAGTQIPASFQPDNPFGIVNMAAFAGSAALITLALFANKGQLKRWHGFTGLALYTAFTGASIAYDQSPEIKTDKNHQTVISAEKNSYGQSRKLTRAFTP
jgi:cation:H+ antiporter